MSRRKAGGQASTLLGSQLVFNSLICSMVQVISPGARPLLALKDLSVISTSAAFRLRKILNNDLPTSRHVHAPSDRSIESTGVPSYLISSKNRRDLSSRPCVISRLKPWLFASWNATLYKYVGWTRTEPQIIPEEIAGILPAHASKSRSITFEDRARGRSTFRRIKIPR